MKIETCIDSLVSYAMNCGLAEPEDHQVLINRLLDLLRLDSYEPSDELQSDDLEEILAGILDFACAKGMRDDGITARDIFDTRIMGAITPMPREVIRTFREKYERNPVEATDWYYKFSCDTDYIRRYRIVKDMRWKYPSEYGEMDITINLSKPEKDPKAIAAARNAPQTAYPKCQLCRLKGELAALKDAILAGSDIGADEVLSKHAHWVAELKTRHSNTGENAMDILLQETGRVFAAVLEDAGVYKNTPEGAAAFSRFVDRVNEEVSV